jgi:hypothetical protein
MLRPYKGESEPSQAIRNKENGKQRQPQLALDT